VSEGALSRLAGRHAAGLRATGDTLLGRANDHLTAPRWPVGIERHA